MSDNFLIELGSKILSYKDPQVGEYLLYQILAIIILSWFALCVFLIMKKPKTLEHWRYPNFANISVISIVGGISFFISSLCLSVLSSFQKLLGDTELKVTFFPMLVFMSFYIILGLIVINERKNIHSSGEYIPIEIKTFMKKSLTLFFGLVFILISLEAFLVLVGKSSVAPGTNNISSVIGGILSLLVGGSFLAVTLAETKTQLYLNKFVRFSHNHPIWFVTLMVLIILFALTAQNFDKISSAIKQTLANWKVLIALVCVVIILLLLALNLKRRKK